MLKFSISSMLVEVRRSLAACPVVIAALPDCCFREHLSCITSLQEEERIQAWCCAPTPIAVKINWPLAAAFVSCYLGKV